MKSSHILTALCWAFTGIRLFADPEDPINPGSNPRIKVESAVAKTSTPPVSSEIALRFDEEIDLAPALDISKYSLRQVPAELEYEDTCGLLEDLDGDGDLDLVLVIGDKIVAHRNEGSAIAPNYAQYRYQLAEIISSGFGPDSYEHSFNIVFGDINGDGRRDIVCSEKFIGEITCLIRSTDPASWPAFGTSKKLHHDVARLEPLDNQSGDPVTYYPKMAVEDVNGDGKSDIVFGNLSASQDQGFYQLPVCKGTGLLDNEGIPLFDPPVEFRLPQFSSSSNPEIDGTPFFHNTDGDDDVDLIYATTSGGYMLFKNEGTVTDTSSPGFGMPIYAGNGNFLNSGGFDLIIPHNPYYYRASNLADYNGDGDLDILFLTNSLDKRGRNILCVLENITSDPYAYQFASSPLPLGISGHEIDVLSHRAQSCYFDFDGDKKIDVLQVDPYKYLIYYNLDTGEDHQPAFSTPIEIPVSSSFSYLLSGGTPDIVDFDDDGLLDPQIDGVLVGSYFGLVFIKFTGPGLNGAPQFDDPVQIGPVIPDWNGLVACTAGDVNGDDKLDVIISPQIAVHTVAGGGTLKLLINSSTDSFALSAPVEIQIDGLSGHQPPNNIITSPEIFDFDGDGDGDLVVSDSQTYSMDHPSHNIRYLRNEGETPPRFTNLGFLKDHYGDPISVSYDATPRLVNFDKDGSPDLLIGSREKVITPFMSIKDAIDLEFLDPDSPDPPVLFLPASPTLKISGTLPTEVILSDGGRNAKLIFPTLISDGSKLDINELYLDGVRACAISNIDAKSIYRDTDKDGLIDTEEVTLGTDPNNADTDGDGIDDSDEYDLGMSPLIPRITAFKEIRNANGTVTFTWTSHATHGSFFNIEEKNPDGTWKILYQTTYGSAKLPFVPGVKSYSMTLNPATDYTP